MQWYTRGKNKYIRFWDSKNTSKPKPIYAIFENFSPGLPTKKKTPPEKKTHLVEKPSMCWVFFPQNLIFSETKIHGRKGCFLRSLYGWDHDGRTPIMVSESGAKTGKESGWLYWHLQNLMFFHTFFGFQKILKRQFLMMWCHNTDVFFFCCCFPLMVQVQDCWVLPKMVWFWRLM